MKSSSIIKYLIIILLTFNIALILFGSMYRYGQNKPSIIGESNVKIIGEFSYDKINWFPLVDEIGNNKKNVFIRGNLERELEKNIEFSFFVHNISVEMYVNGNLLYSFGEDGTYEKFSNTPGISYGRIITQIKTTDYIEFHLKNNEPKLFTDSYNLLLSSMRLTQGGELYEEAWIKHWWFIILSCCVSLIGVFVLILSTMWWRKEDYVIMLKGLSFSFFAFISGFYMLVDILFMYMPLFVKNPLLCNYFDMSPLILIIPAFCLYFYSNLTMPKLKKIMETCLYIVIAVSVFSILVQIVGISNIYEMQYLILPIGIIGGTVGVICVVYEWVKTRSREIFFAIITFLPMLLATVLDLLNVYLDVMPKRVIVAYSIPIVIVLQIYQISDFVKKQLQDKELRNNIEKELIESKISLMMSQIQPHFLFNSLNAIGQLCKTSPEKAENAVDEFALYLRGNIDSLLTKNMIYFENEIEHVKSYLSLEKMRYGDKLNITWDIKVVDFLIPPLALQPIVENAVRYGIFPKDEGGEIKITSEIDNENYIVTVEDDGVGFDINKPLSNERAHIGIANVRARLEAMCNGSLEIFSSINKGTKVILKLSGTQQNNKNTKTKQ